MEEDEAADRVGEECDVGGRIVVGLVIIILLA